MNNILPPEKTNVNLGHVNMDELKAQRRLLERILYGNFQAGQPEDNESLEGLQNFLDHIYDQLDPP